MTVSCRQIYKTTFCYNVYLVSVLKGITNDDAERVNDVFVVRPYIKYGNETIYGSPMIRSVYEVALSLKEEGYPNLDAEGISMVDSILDICK